MRRMLWVVAVAGCSTHSPSTGTGEIALANSSPALPANEAHGHAGADFTNRSLDSRICQSATTFGACVVHSSCQIDDTSVNHASAGEITIGTFITLTPNASGMYGSAGYADDRISTPGTQLAVHAAGDEIAAFELSLTSPEALTVLAPSRATTAFARTSDLAIAWSGLTTGTAAVTIADGLDRASSIECAFPGAAGIGTIPAAALAAFGGDAGALTITSAASASTTLEAWTVIFDVADDAAWADGATGPMALTFHD